MTLLFRSLCCTSLDLRQSNRRDAAIQVDLFANSFSNVYTCFVVSMLQDFVCLSYLCLDDTQENG